MKSIPALCHQCRKMPSTGLWLVTRTAFGRGITKAERLCASCGMRLSHNLVASFLDHEMPQHDVPPGLKQTAITQLKPEMALPSGLTVREMLVIARRNATPSHVHPSLRR